MCVCVCKLSHQILRQTRETAWRHALLLLIIIYKNNRFFTGKIQIPLCMEEDESDSGSYESASEGEVALQGGAQLPELTDEERHRLDRERQGEQQHGCTHYRRRCRLVAPCCGEYFWCR